MSAYHNDPQLKAQFVRLLEWHREQDKIVQGTYQDDETAGKQFAVNGWKFESFGRGCAVGCSIESLRIITKRTDLNYQDHAAYEELIGVPRVLARLEDSIFESLPLDEAREWPIKFAQAIPVGTDLSLVWSRFAVWLLGDPQDGVIKFAETDGQRTAIQGVIDLYLRRLEGQEPTRDEWKAAAYAARVAAAYATADAAYAAAYATADAAYATDVGTYAARAAAYATDVGTYAADAAARTQAQQKQATKLLELLAAA